MASMLSTDARSMGQSKVTVTASEVGTPTPTFSGRRVGGRPGARVGPADAPCRETPAATAIATMAIATRERARWRWTRGKTARVMARAAIDIFWFEFNRP
jgi:hypothetical protein